MKKLGTQKFSLFFIIVSVIFLSYPASTQNEAQGTNGWPEPSQIAAREMTVKYGQPDFSNPDIMIWLNKGQWKTIAVTGKERGLGARAGSTEILEQTIRYSVAGDKLADLSGFDGRITVDRNQQLLIARSNKEANNLLVLNLAHEVIVGQKSAEEAKKAYEEIILGKQNGISHKYLQKLTFPVEINSNHSSRYSVELTTAMEEN